MSLGASQTLAIDSINTITTIKSTTHTYKNKTKYNENANKFENILVKFSFFSHVNGKFNIKHIVYVGST